ncbi:MAG: hypothetical protein JJT89_14260 [Nitriliruptoraceae bacterium]|nr:hypothetical protein [Nitriliruptoraceae bacterium]
MSDAEAADPTDHGADAAGSDRVSGGDDAAGSPDRADLLAVYASAQLVESDAEVGAIGFDPDDAGRPLGDGREVSGWSMFTGEESDEELTDAELVRLPSLRWVLSRDPAVAFVTSGHDGTRGYWTRAGDRGDGLPSWERIVP